MILITIITAILNFIIGWYILFTIPKKIKTVLSNQKIILKEILK